MRRSAKTVIALVPVAILIAIGVGAAPNGESPESSSGCNSLRAPTVAGKPCDSRC
jgi:hypothetical protein